MFFLFNLEKAKKNFKSFVFVFKVFSHLEGERSYLTFGSVLTTGPKGTSTHKYLLLLGRVKPRLPQLA
jgi:hypothetical protein